MNSVLRHSRAGHQRPPTVFGRNAVLPFFTPEEIRELLELAAALAA